MFMSPLCPRTVHRTVRRIQHRSVFVGLFCAERADRDIIQCLPSVSNYHKYRCLINIINIDILNILILAFVSSLCGVSNLKSLGGRKYVSFYRRRPFCRPRHFVISWNNVIRFHSPRALSQWTQLTSWSRRILALLSAKTVLFISEMIFTQSSYGKVPNPPQVIHDPL